MTNINSVDQLDGVTIYGNDGGKIGSVGQVYLDDQNSQPTFVTVRTGMFGAKETFIPVSKATRTHDGLEVPFDKAFVKDAPNVDADGSLTPEEERRLYEYYSMDYGQGTDGADERHHDAAPKTTGRAGQDAGVAAGGDRESVVARDEHLNVGTERRESGQVRLRKHTRTDTETAEVPVSREELVVERESVDPNSVEAQRGGDEDVTVTAHEDVPVVHKTETAEKVTVDKKTVRGTEQVSETVEHEDVEVEGNDTAAGRRDRRS